MLFRIIVTVNSDYYCCKYGFLYTQPLSFDDFNIRNIILIRYHLTISKIQIFDCNYGLHKLQIRNFMLVITDYRSKTLELQLSKIWKSALKQE